MKFRLVESINTYYRAVLYDKRNGKYTGLFMGLGEYLKELYDNDSEIYDDLNYNLSELECALQIPELDYKNKNYNFAFTTKALNMYKDQFENLQWYIDEYSPFEFVLDSISIDDKNIIYKDDLLVAWEV